MPTRYVVSVQYGGGTGSDVGVEVDVAYVTEKEYDENVERWRNPDGTFATAPKVTSAADLRPAAQGVKNGVADSMRSKELRDAIKGASIDAVEDGEVVGGFDGPTGEIVNVTRIDADGDGEVDHRYTYDIRQGTLRRFD